MSDSKMRSTGDGLVWRQFLIGQTFGVVFAVLLFLIEPLWLMRHAHAHLGAPLISILSVYVALGWVLGAVMGILWGVIGRVFAGARRSDGTVPGLGPTLGFLMMALFMVRIETSQTLKTLPTGLMVSLAAALLAWVGLGYLGRRFLARYVPTERRSFVLKTLALASVFTFAGVVVVNQLGSVRVPRRSPVSASSPNIVLIVVDALRPDHLSTYGYDRETSPNLDRLASNAIVFENAYAHGNRTILSMPSLFTSLYPSFHGVISFNELAAPLSPDKTTLADVCRAAGYATVGVMSNINLKSAFGMTKGFDFAEEFDVLRYRLSVYRLLTRLGLVEKPRYISHAPDATVITNRGIDWLQRIGDRPFFLFLHYMDVHHPYDPPEEYVRMFETEGIDIDPKMLFAKTAAMVKRPPPLHLTREELTRLKDLYDACIRYTDDEIGRFLDELASSALERETVVIFTADHGDEFLEQGMLYHNNLTIESLIRVPLVIGRIPPEGAGDTRRSVAGIVRHVDLLPTVADLVGGETPPTVQGASLEPLLDGGDEWSADYTIAEGDYCTSLNVGQWKMMYVDTTETYHLYKLDEDPLGKVDVSDRYPAQAAELRVLIDDYMASAAGLNQGDRKQLSDEAVKQLRALGYIQ
jgi:arylsulfatase A-like enzyme